MVTGLIFYDTKVTVMNRVLNATVQRTADHAAPEITLDPLEIVGGMHYFHFVYMFIVYTTQFIPPRLNIGRHSFYVSHLFFRCDKVIREHIFFRSSMIPFSCLQELFVVSHLYWIFAYICIFLYLWHLNIR